LSLSLIKPLAIFQIFFLCISVHPLCNLHLFQPIFNYLLALQVSRIRTACWASSRTKTAVRPCRRCRCRRRRAPSRRTWAAALITAPRTLRRTGSTASGWASSGGRRDGGSSATHWADPYRPSSSRRPASSPTRWPPSGTRSSNCE